MHTLSKKKGKKGFFAIKIVLANTYDKINWELIWRTLVEIGIPDKMINLVMHRVTSVETNINWNGSRGEFFPPQHGIRQANLISPYLFVLCMDKLSHIIEHEVNQKNRKGVKVGKKGNNISHLMFADDLLLFGEANEKQMKSVTKSLSTFCNLSGQEVNKNKSSILFSNNVKIRMRTIKIIYQVVVVLFAVSTSWVCGFSKFIGSCNDFMVWCREFTKASNSVSLGALGSL